MVVVVEAMSSTASKKRGRGKVVAHHATGVKKVKGDLGVKNTMAKGAYVAIGQVVEDATQRVMTRTIQLHGPTESHGSKTILTDQMVMDGILSMIPKAKHGEVCKALNDALDQYAGVESE